MFLNSGGSLTIQGGTVDLADGDVTVNTGASVTVGSGSTFNISDNNRELYVVGGSVDISGTVDVNVDLEVSSGGTINVNSGANMTVGDDLFMSDNSSLNISGGTLDIADLVEANNSDIDISGGIFDTGAGGGDWIWVYNGGSMTQSGGTVTTAGDMYVEDATLSMTGGTYTGDDYYVYGTSTVDLDGGTVNTDDLYAYGTATLTVDGSDLNTGIISAQGDGTLNLTSGTVTSNDYMYTEGNAVLNIATTVTNTAGAGNGFVDIYIYSNSTINVLPGADVSGYNDITFEGNDTGTASLNVTGGSIAVEDDINLDNSSNDQINISGGTVTVPNDVDILDSNAQINVTGGTLDAGVIDDTSNGGSTVSDNINVSGSGSVSEGGTVVLPVELVHFTASLENGHATLTWETAAELNNERFEVQKSTDGINFLTIASVKGHGTTSEKRYYTYSDKNLTIGTFYYRLIQYDFDGESEVLPTISLVNKMQLSNSSIKVYPNPVFDDFISIRLEGKIITSEWTASLYNMKGQIVLKAIGAVGSPSMTFDNLRSQVEPGMYMLQVAGKDDSFSKRIIIK
jgi:hypothetical protein